MQTRQTNQILRPVELIPVIGYIRVSTWFEEKISDELQKAAIEEATRRRGRVVVRWIVDLDATGRNFKRKIMQGIEAVESGAVEGAREIWVWKFSRFGRNRHGVAVNLARIEAAGGQLISATEEVDASTATGGLTRDMLFAIAHFESNRIGEQWRETHEYRRVHGLPATGGPRFGYVWHAREIEDGVLRAAEHYEPDPDTAETVRALYEDYVYKNVSMRILAQTLNDQGAINPAARQDEGWSRQALLGYLDTGFPAGLLRVHRSEVACANRGDCKREGHWGFIAGAQPPILSDELWDAYREKRELRKRLPPRARIARYPYSGLATCGLCGGRSSACQAKGCTAFRCSRKYQQQERYDDCPGTFVALRIIEKDVKAWLRKLAGEVDSRLSGTVLQPRPMAPAIDAGQRERLSAALAKIQKGLDRASMAHAMGDMPRDSYLRVRDDLTAKRDKLEAQLTALTEVPQDVPVSAWESRGAVVRGLLEEWDTLPVPAKRDLLATVVTEIKLFPKGVEPRVVPVPRAEYVF